MPINFPSSPTVNDVYTSGSFSWKWDGVTWIKVAYTHPNTDGYLHVPATGTTNNGKALIAGSTPGSFSWGSISGGGADTDTIYISIYVEDDGSTQVYDFAQIYDGVVPTPVSIASLPNGHKFRLIVQSNLAATNGITDYTKIQDQNGNAAQLIFGKSADGVNTPFPYMHSGEQAVLLVEKELRTGTDYFFKVIASLGPNTGVSDVSYDISRSLKARLIEMDTMPNVYTPGGTATAITLSRTGEILATNKKYSFIAGANNSGAATTINLNSTGVKNLYLPGGTTAPTLTAGNLYEVWYNGTNFYCNPPPTASSGTTNPGAILYSYKNIGGSL